MALKIAVTGASGFIGRHVLARLAVEDVMVVTAGRHAAVPAGASTHVQFDLAQSPADAYSVLGRPDVLIHLAWQGLPNYSSLHHFEVELRHQYDFLKAMVSAGLRRVLVTGTCFEYGMQQGALAESLPSQPATPYGFAKAALQQSLGYLCAAQGTELTWARLFYLWGAGQARNSLYASLAAAAERGDDSFDMSAGEQLRDYLGIAQAADLLVRLALRDRGGGVVNVCSGVPTSVGGMVDRWIADHGWRIRLNKGRYPYPAHEPMAFWGDRRKLDAILGATR